jgi:nucleolar MIF4G domain-containing protein 1
LSDIVLSAIQENEHILASMVAAFAALISMLHVQVGTVVGALMLEDIVHEFDSRYNAGDMKRASNVLQLITQLYSFDVIHCTFVYDLIRHLCVTFSTNDVELLLVILRGMFFCAIGELTAYMHIYIYIYICIYTHVCVTTCVLALT